MEPEDEYPPDDAYGEFSAPPQAPGTPAEELIMRELGATVLEEIEHGN
jgi:DNA polymerase-3 subunit gamma/tau